jgi:peptide/nickel transport system ATP-binding protein
VSLLLIQSLAIAFKSGKEMTNVVSEISYDLQKGETLGIVGESGSGKSVSSMAVMGLNRFSGGKITEGKIIFDSPTLGKVDLVALPEKDFRKIRGKEISMIFQEPMTALNPVLRCGDQVKEVLQIHTKLSVELIEKKVLELFELVKLPRPAKLMNAYPHEISGGQKQRVVIAMAMACDPLLIIADEPTTALDVTVQASILDLLKELQRTKGTSIIFISHDLGVIGEVADKVLVMYRGEIKEQQNVVDLFKNPQHPYTKGLLACRPTLDITSTRLLTIEDVIAGKTLVEAEPKKENINEALQLVVEGLCTWFPLKKKLFSNKVEYVKAVDEVSFEVRKGETLGLVGESGCGKTTLGRTVMRLEDSIAGKITFEGRDITHLKGRTLKALRKDIQIIFQDPYASLNPRMTIEQTLIEPMKVNKVLSSYSERKEKAIYLLEKVGLSEDHLQRYPHEFSGGQRQRINIARTLTLSPKLIICDESVSALDVSVQAQVLNLLNDLKDEFGFTYIFISHDLSVVKFISDRIIVMNKGRIEEEGEALEIYRNPKSAYTKSLIDAIPTGELDRIIAIQKEKELSIVNA